MRYPVISPIKWFVRLIYIAQIIQQGMVDWAERIVPYRFPLLGLGVVALYLLWASGNWLSWITILVLLALMTLLSMYDVKFWYSFDDALLGKKRSPAHYETLLHARVQQMWFSFRFPLLGILLLFLWNRIPLGGARLPLSDFLSYSMILLLAGIVYDVLRLLVFKKKRKKGR
jgi:hypothetical protein